MKKIILCILTLCVIFCGCQKIDVNGNMDNKKFEKLSEEEITDKYNYANNVLHILFGKGLDVDNSDVYTDEHGFYEYYAVTFNGITSIEELKNYLNTIFSPDITNELINIGVTNIFDRYVEKDNKLYQINYDYSIMLRDYNIEETNAEVKKCSDTKYIYSIEKSVNRNSNTDETIPDKDSNSKYNFEYVYEYIDSKWVFTDFPILRPYMDLDYQYNEYTGKYETVTEVADYSVIENSFNIAKQIEECFVVSSEGISDVFDKEISIGERTYYKVYNQNIKNMDDLINYMKTVFSDEVIDIFIKTNTFVEIDNELYVAFFAFPIMAYVITETHAEKVNDNKYMYYIKLSELSDDAITYTSNYIIKEYPYEYIDGRWVFTDFPSTLR